jgi:hypothetical protein
VLTERQKLLKRLKGVCHVGESQKIKIVEVERLLKALSETYSHPADKVPRLLLWDSQLLVTRLYKAQGNMKEVLASVQQVFIQLGFVITGADSPLETFRVVEWGLVVDHLVEAFLHARDAYQAIEVWSNAKKVEDYARTTVLVHKFLPPVRTRLPHNINTTTLHLHNYAATTPNFTRVRSKCAQRS